MDISSFNQTQTKSSIPTISRLNVYHYQHMWALNWYSVIIKCTADYLIWCLELWAYTVIWVYTLIWAFSEIWAQTQFEIMPNFELMPKFWANAQILLYIPTPACALKKFSMLAALSALDLNNYWMEFTETWFKVSLWSVDRRTDWRTDRRTKSNLYAPLF